MQLPMTNSMSMPSRYNSYFATSNPTSSRPIAINNRCPQRFNERESRLMGLDFTPPHVPEVVDSFYVMDFMDYEDTTPSTSTQQTQQNLDQLFRRIPTEDKENGPHVKNEGDNMIMLGEFGHRSYKRPTPPMDENLIHEETESETGISDDDDNDCRSNCGCVHSAYSLEPTSAPSNRFRSIADIIGYAQVVKAERAAALAELQSAVEKWQQNAHFRAAQH